MNESFVHKSVYIKENGKNNTFVGYCVVLVPIDILLSKHIVHSPLVYG